MSKETQRDVTEAAKSLAENLKIRGFGHPLRIEVGEARDTDAEGSAIQVATLGNKKYPVIEVWYDKYLDSNNYNYWVGFISKKFKLVEDLYSNFIETKGYEGTVDNAEHDDYKYVRVERFYIDSYINDDEYLCWFGVYTPSFSAYHVRRVADFIESVLYTLPAFAGKIYREGSCKQVTTNIYERNHAARNNCIKCFGYSCQVCDMNFKDNYGEIGNDFIHVHHKEELSKSGERETNPAHHLVPVCPNCHAMLHRGDTLLTVEELRAIWKKHHP